MGAYTFEVVRMCFSSIIYHHEVISHKLPKKHRFLIHPLYICLPPSFMLKVKVLSYDESVTCDKSPLLTGVPPHIAIMNDISVLGKTIKDTSNVLIKTLISELDKRGIGGETFQENEVLSDVKKLNGKIEQLLNNHNYVVRSGDRDSEIIPMATITDENVSLMVDGNNGVDRRMVYFWGS